jgi:anti-sigma factor ChrR (cupin superfamily)
MKIHADLSQRAVVDSNALDWVASPESGVERRMLDRDGAELARATSIVRYAPGSAFAAHSHELGEEFLVLEGVFSDSSGDFPAGTYVRNPPGSSHAPWSEEGCTILVKLRQFHPRDAAVVRVDTHSTAWRPGQECGLEVMPLHQFGSEQVALVRWAPNTRFSAHVHHGGEEIFVLAGSLCDEQGRYPRGTWLRNPPGSRHAPWSEEGATILVKVGHLPQVVA